MTGALIGAKLHGHGLQGIQIGPDILQIGAHRCDLIIADTVSHDHRGIFPAPHGIDEMFHALLTDGICFMRRVPAD